MPSVMPKAEYQNAAMIPMQRPILQPQPAPYMGAPPPMYPQAQNMLGPLIHQMDHLGNQIILLQLLFPTGIGIAPTQIAPPIGILQDPFIPYGAPYQPIVSQALPTHPPLPVYMQSKFSKSNQLFQHQCKRLQCKQGCLLLQFQQCLIIM